MPISMDIAVKLANEIAQYRPIPHSLPKYILLGVWIYDSFYSEKERVNSCFYLVKKDVIYDSTIYILTTEILW